MREQLYFVVNLLQLPLTTHDTTQASKRFVDQHRTDQEAEVPYFLQLYRRDQSNRSYKQRHGKENLIAQKRREEEELRAHKRQQEEEAMVRTNQAYWRHPKN